MKITFKKFKHDWSYEINWNHNLPIYGEGNKDEQKTEKS